MFAIHKIFIKIPRDMWEIIQAKLRAAHHYRVIKAKAGSDEEYNQYLKAQIDKTVWASHWESQRTDRLVGKVAELGLPLAGHHVLCVGCRNTNELEQMESIGFGQVTGIDLFSQDPRIQVMDMHDMQFKDNTFDVVYSCHNLEHSYDHSVVIAQIIRVLKPGGHVVVEVPLCYETSATDLVDFGAVDGLLEAFGSVVDEVKWKIEIPGDERTCQAIFSIQKKSA